MRRTAAVLALLLAATAWNLAAPPAIAAPTTFQPGDALLLRAGAVWNGQLWSKGSGTSAARIRIDRYGDGPKPLIHGGGNIQGAVHVASAGIWSVISSNTLLQFNEVYNDARVRFNISQNDKGGVITLCADWPGPGSTTPVMRRYSGEPAFGLAYIYNNNIFYTLGTNSYLPLPGTVDGYKLATGSPALGSGTNTGVLGDRDYWGNPVGSGAPNRGAYNGPGVIPGQVNLAFNGTVTSSSSVECCSFHRPNLVDGSRHSIPHESGGFSSQIGNFSQHQEWVAVRSADRRTFSSVVLYPRNDSGFVGRGFPQRFHIQVWNGYVLQLAELEVRP